MKSLFVKINKSSRYPKGLIKYTTILANGEKHTQYLINSSSMKISTVLTLLNNKNIAVNELI